MTLNLSAFYYDYKDYQAFAQLGPVQTVINQDAEAQGLEVELNAQPDGPADAAARRLVHGQRGQGHPAAGPRDRRGPRPAAGAAPSRPMRSHATSSRSAAASASIQGDVLYTDDFCFTALCAPVEAGGVVHRRQCAHRLCGAGRALGGRGVREQPVRGGVPRVRLRQLAVLGRGRRRVRRSRAPTA